MDGAPPSDPIRLSLDELCRSLCQLKAKSGGRTTTTIAVQMANTGR
jgi:hypothetical protein